MRLIQSVDNKQLAKQKLNSWEGNMTELQGARNTKRLCGTSRKMADT